MQALLTVILPVFLVIGFGYVAVAAKWFSDAGTDALMKFTQTFAIPCLLFSAIARLDLSGVFEWELLLSFYSGATAGFVAGLLGGRFLFGRSWQDSVSIGFCCLFSNSVLLGLSIVDRAYGGPALEAAFAIVAVHSVYCYGLGITVMEIVRSETRRPLPLIRTVSRAMFRNALILGIALGFAVNLSGLPLPATLNDALEMMTRAALPAALFGLGGVLVRYRPEGDLKTVLFVCLVSLAAHPTVTYAMGSLLNLNPNALRAAVLTGAMPPGINTFIFASMYGAAKRVAATGVLIATALAIGTVWVWLQILG